MKFKRQSKINAGLKQMDIVPLIDCIFLLLIFFMLSSNFVSVPGINVNLPKAISTEKIDTRPLTLVISSENIIYIEDKPHTRDEIEEYFRKEKIDSIFIKADKEANLEAIVAIWDICMKLDINRIGVATTQK